MRVKPIFAWYDLWIGAFYDRAKRRLYVFPAPMIGFYVEWSKVSKWRDASPAPAPNVAGHITPQMIRDTAGWSQSEDDLRQTLQWAADALDAALAMASPPADHSEGPVE